MNYTFDKSKINSEIGQLKMMTTNIITQMDIIALSNLIGETREINLFKSSPKCFDVYKKLYNSILKYNYLTLVSYEPKSIWNLKNKNISVDDILTIVHDFFESRSEEIYDYFMYNFQDRKTNLELIDCSSIQEIEAVTSHIKRFRESYIRASYTGTISDAVTLAHEYGHATMYSYSNNILENPNSLIYRELDGVFFENEMIDYLIEKGICTEDAIKISIINDIRMHESARCLTEQYDLQELIYLLSHMISIELSYSQCKDELLKQMISAKPKSPIKALRLVNENFNLNEHTEMYRKKIDENAQKIGLKY